ncbi:MAG TPA: hypothetical protein VMU30_03000, partial [Bacteroidota bacterium]|nr:hypothetical protein [Bacteroidota bacterium]
FPGTIGSLKCSGSCVAASGASVVEVYDIPSVSVKFSSSGYKSTINQLGFTSDGSWLFVADNTNIELWNVSDGTLIQQQNLSTYIIALGILKSQKTFFTIGSYTNPVVTFYNYVGQKIWTPVTQ